MIKNKKGLSSVVTTLIIILLTLIAIGIIWVVIERVVTGGTGQIDLAAKCLEVDIKATAVTNTAGTNYDVTLKRTAGGDEIGGVKIVIFNSIDNSGVLDFGATLEQLETKTNSFEATNIANANKIETTVYFIDDSGKEQLCTQTNTFNF